MYRFYLYVWLNKYNCYWLVNTYSSYSAAQNSKAVKKYPDSDFVILKKSYHDGSYNHVDEFINEHKSSFYRVIGKLHSKEKEIIC